MKKKFVPVTTKASVIAKSSIFTIVVLLTGFMYYFIKILDKSLQWTSEEYQTLGGLIVAIVISWVVFHVSSNYRLEEIAQQKKEQGIT